MEPAEDLVVKVTIVEGAEYVSLPEGDEFNVLAGKTVPVKARISIPETARVGSVYNAEVLFKTLSASREGDEGMVSFTTGHSKSFEIEVIPTIRNRLIGYGKKGGKNWKNHKKKKQFMPSGLIGPIEIRLFEKIE